MTVVAWDGVTLAADKRMTYGGHVNTVTKIHRVGDYIIGFTGSTKHIGAFRRWAENGMDRDKFPTAPNVDDAVYAIAVRTDGTVWRFEGTPDPMQIEDQSVAAGSGRDYARAAMHLGKTAREAVEIACLFDENCGNGIDTLTLDGGAPEDPVVLALLHPCPECAAAPGAVCRDVLSGRPTGPHRMRFPFYAANHQGNGAPV